MMLCVLLSASASMESPLLPYPLSECLFLELGTQCDFAVSTNLSLRLGNSVCWHHVLLSRWAAAFVPTEVFQRGWLWCGISVMVASTEEREGKASPVPYHLLLLPPCGPHSTPKCRYLPAQNALRIK